MALCLCSATSCGSSDAPIIRKSEPPAFALSKQSLAFTSSLADSTGAQTVDIVNAGVVPVGALTVTIPYIPQQPVDWLTATLNTATAPATLTVRTKAGIIGAGNYMGMIIVASPDAPASTDTIDVSFSVLPTPSIALASNAAVFNQLPATLATARTVAVTSSNPVPLKGLSATVRYATDQSAGWLTVSLDGTTSPATLTLRPNNASLAIGTYTATVDITSSSSNVATKSLSVTLSVGPLPTIVVAPTLSLAPPVTSNGTSFYSIPISNGGGGLLHDVMYAVTFSPGQPATWMSVANVSVAPVTVGEPASFGLFTYVSGLARGTYNATITIASPDATNSPVAVGVTLTFNF